MKQNQLLFGVLVCIIGAIFYCYEFILRIIPGVLQTELCAAFGHISATTFGQLSAFYYFAYSPMQLPVGILMDRFGPRKLLTFACFSCAIGSYLFASSSSIFIAGGGRFLVGFGSSFAFVGVLVLTLNWLPKQLFSSVAGLITTLGMLGVIYGEVHLTEMTEIIGLEAVLSGVVIFGLILTLVIFLIVRDSKSATFAKEEKLSSFFQDAWHVFTSPQIWIIGFMGACLYTSLSVFGELWGKTYIEQAHHLSKIEAAKTISYLFLGWAVGAPLAGFLSDRTCRRISTLIFGALGAFFCISAILYYPNLSTFSLNSLLFLYGTFSGVEIIVFIMAKESSQAKLSSTVFATTNMIVTLGGVVFQPLVGWLLDVSHTDLSMESGHGYSITDYQLAFSILPISLLLVVILSFFLSDNTTPE